MSVNIIGIVLISGCAEARSRRRPTGKVSKEACLELIGGALSSSGALFVVADEINVGGLGVFDVCHIQALASMFYNILMNHSATSVLR